MGLEVGPLAGDEVMRAEVSGMVLVLLYKGPPSAPSPFLPVRTQGEGIVYEPESRLLPNSTLAITVLLAFLTFEIVRNKFILCF